MKKTYILVHDTARSRALQAVLDAPAGHRVVIDEPRRTASQNDHFHALCGDIAKSGIKWMGKPRTPKQWKVLLVSGHAVATKEEAEVVPGLEGEFVNIRESTALMSVKRGASLIEYTLAFCANNDIPVHCDELEPA